MPVTHEDESMLDLLAGILRAGERIDWIRAHPTCTPDEYEAMVRAQAQAKGYDAAYEASRDVERLA